MEDKLPVPLLGNTLVNKRNGFTVISSVQYEAFGSHHCNRVMGQHIGDLV